MSNPSVDTLLNQARQAHQQQIDSFDDSRLQQNILASLAKDVSINPAPAALAPRKLDLVWSWLTNPWWISTAALLPLAIGFSLGSLDSLQSLEQLGDGLGATQELLAAEPTWGALAEESYE